MNAPITHGGNVIEVYFRPRDRWLSAMLADRRLTGQQKSIGVVLSLYAGSDAFTCAVSHAELATAAGCSIYAIRGALAELRRCGWIDSRPGAGNEVSAFRLLLDKEAPAVRRYG